MASVTGVSGNGHLHLRLAAATLFLQTRKILSPFRPRSGFGLTKRRGVHCNEENVMAGRALKSALICMRSGNVGGLSYSEAASEDN